MKYKISNSEIIRSMIGLPDDEVLLLSVGELKQFLAESLSEKDYSDGLQKIKEKERKS